MDLKHPMMYSLGNKKLHLLVEFRTPNCISGYRNVADDLIIARIANFDLARMDLFGTGVRNLLYASSLRLRSGQARSARQTTYAWGKKKHPKRGASVTNTM